ncbi:hypothetical protein AgCh_013680 [Apium graveolens]
MKIPQILMDPVCKMVQVFDDAAPKDETVETLKRRKVTEESKTTSDIAQVVQSEESSKQQATKESANPEQVIKTSTSNRDQVDLGKMTVTDKKKLLWKNVKPSDPKKSQLLFDFLTVGLNSREARDRSGLGSSEAKLKTGVEVIIKDPFLLTDKPLEEATQKHLDKVISVQVVLDAHDKSNVKEKLILFLKDGRTYRMSESDVLNKSLKELQFFHYLLEIKSEITRRWSNFIMKTIRDKARISGSRVAEFFPKIVEDDGREIPMKKDSAKMEVILKEKCLCYNKDSSHPGIIRIRDGLERNHISALRTAIYQIGSQDEEMKKVKATLAQVLRNAEEKLISNFVKNHIGFRLIHSKQEEAKNGEEPCNPNTEVATKNAPASFSDERTQGAEVTADKEGIIPNIELSESEKKDLTFVPSFALGVDYDIVNQVCDDINKEHEHDDVGNDDFVTPK